MARTGPVSSGVRRLRELRDGLTRRPWLAEGVYDQGLEAIHVTMDEWTSDLRLIHRREGGVWVVDANVFARLQAADLGESAEAWLATLL